MQPADNREVIAWEFLRSMLCAQLIYFHEGLNGLAVKRPKNKAAGRKKVQFKPLGVYKILPSFPMTSTRIVKQL